MPREHALYRPTLEDILAFSGGERILTLTQVAQYVGRENRWVKKHLGIDRNGITAMALAAKLAREYSG